MKITLSVALAVTALVSVVSSAPLTHDKREEVKFTYGEDNAGPQHWAQLDPLFGTCGTGKKQSPIDVEIGAPYVNLTDKAFSNLDYKPLNDVLCGFDGHAVKCEWTKTNTTNTNSVTIKGTKFDLDSFHFHTPSEHRVNGRFADGELHLVHQSSSGALAVIGLLLEIKAQNNPFLNWVTALDKKVDRAAKGHGYLVKNKAGEKVDGKEQVKYKVKEIDFSSILSTTGQFSPRWEYDGSLTTPPCTEGVSWNVVQNTIGMGLRQFDALVDLEKFNSRFLQDRE
ncbi:hypothetical protein BGZ76_011818 [Entomortierella beljakovae]|nr:hypothetical protein BGZ76_011818 [Entomortierella beljakovae]